MKFYIQSYVDLITNSSTSVFQFANNVDAIKKVVDAILSAANSELRCEDLFDISIEYDINLEDASDFYLEKAEEFKDDSQLNELVERYHALCALYEWKKSEDLLQIIYERLISEHSVENLQEYAQTFNESSCEWFYSSSYVFTAKDSDNLQAAIVMRSLNNLFDYEACYC